MIFAVWSSAGEYHVDERVRRLEGRFGCATKLERRGAGALLRWGASDGRRQGERFAVGRDENSAWVGWNVAGGLACGRGKLGGEPLYWAKDARGWMVASRLEAVLATLDGSPHLDLTQMGSVVAALPPVDERATPYLDVQRFLSGEERVFPPGARRVGDGLDERPRDALQDLVGTDDALADVMWKAACESVARAARGVRVLGVLAGGGVDSSGLLAAAVAHARERGDLEVIPLTIDIAGRGDDRPHMRALAAWLGVEPLRVQPEDAAPYLRSSLVVDARPSLVASFPLIVAAAMAGKRHGVERVISGFLGDLILDAPGGASFERMKAGSATERVRAMREVARRRDPGSTPPATLLWHAVLVPLLRPLLPGSLLRARRRREFRASLPWAGPRLDAFIAHRAAHAPRRPHLTTADDRFAALASDPQMLEQIELRAQVEVLTGVRFAEPWMDADFCRTIARITPWRLAARQQDRGLFRHALRGRVPDSVRLRRDKAAIVPALDRMLIAAGGEPALADLLAARRLIAHGFVDPEQLKKVTHAYVSRPVGADGREAWATIWSVAAAEELLARAGQP